VATNTTSSRTLSRRYTLGRARREGAATLTIKDVADACGLPQPVIAQLVDRHWVEGRGWMYSQEHLQDAVELAERLRKWHQPR